MNSGSHKINIKIDLWKTFTTTFLESFSKNVWKFCQLFSSLIYLTWICIEKEKKSEKSGSVKCAGVRTIFNVKTHPARQFVGEQSVRPSVSISFSHDADIVYSRNQKTDLKFNFQNFWNFLRSKWKFLGKFNNNLSELWIFRQRNQRNKNKSKKFFSISKKKGRKFPRKNSVKKKKENPVKFFHERKRKG